MLAPCGLVGFEGYLIHHETAEGILAMLGGLASASLLAASRDQLCFHYHRCNIAHNIAHLVLQ